MLEQLKKAIAFLKNNLASDPDIYRASYRIVKIEQDENNDYFVSIQLIGKSIVYKTRPEELLANDKLVNSFSPTDIRNLTYLGYLGVNAPKYKILAKRLSEDSKQTVFALHKRGDKSHRVVTAQDISSNKDILAELDQEDAHMVGFTVATEQANQEEQQKAELRKQLLEQQKTLNKDN